MTDAAVMCSLAPRTTMPSLLRSTIRTYRSGSSCSCARRLRSPLRIGDHLGAAQIIVAAIAVHPLDVLAALRIHPRHLILHGHQRHEHAGYGRADRGMHQQFDAFGEVLGATGNLKNAVCGGAFL